MKKKYLRLHLFSAIVLLLLMVSYVFQVHSLTRENYLIERYQESINGYSQESRSLEYQFLQSNSFFEVENIAKEVDFVRADNVSYIQVTGSEVVVK